MVLAKSRTARRQIILGNGQFAAQRSRSIVRRAHPPKRQVHPLKRRPAIDQGKALGNCHFERQAIEIVEHPRASLRRIILD